MHCDEPGVLPGSEKYIFAVDGRQRSLHYFIASCGHYACTFGYQIRRPFYAHLLLAYINSGVLRISFCGHTCAARAGDIVLMDLQSPHHYHSGETLDFLWFHVDGCNAHAICADINRQIGFVFSHPNQEMIRQGMLELISAFQNHQPVTPAIISARIHALLCLCYPPRGGLPASSSDCVAVVVEYLKTHIADAVTVDDMSRTANLSRYHFSRVFKQETGLSPYQYLLHLRFDYAKHLLKTTSLSVGEIAGRTGFKNEMGFIAAFTDKIGIPPGKYRRLAL